MNAVPTQRVAHPLEALVELVRRARGARDVTALRFIAVNDSHLLAPFQQSALWLEGEGVVALSGVIEIESNAPYVHWLERMASRLKGSPARALTAPDFVADTSREGEPWMPEHVLWVPFAGTGRNQGAGGMLVARPLPWREVDLRLFSEWLETWACIHQAATQPTGASLVKRWLRRLPARLRRRPLLWTAAVAAVGVVPVRLSVLAPGELVPAHPVVVRAPLEGIVKAIDVETNQPVREGQVLFTYDEAVLSSRLDVAAESLRTAEAEQRQLSQQALLDPKARGALANAKGAVEEKRLELDFLRDQLSRSKVLAPRDGVAFVDNPSDLIGRPVTAGQRILRLAEPEDKEVEAWLPVADAIALTEGADVRLYLNATPLEPVAGKLRYVAYEPTHRPDGTYAYRVRALIAGATAHRVGLKGTVRLSGARVPLVYWMVRRPLARVREFLGI